MAISGFGRLQEEKIGFFKRKLILYACVCFIVSPLHQIPWEALATLRSEMNEELLIMVVVLTRGLATAVLATLPTQYEILHSDVFINLAVVTILSTAIMTMVDVVAISRSYKRKSKRELHQPHTVFKLYLCIVGWTTAAA